jgi:hypothetical protein
MSRQKFNDFTQGAVIALAQDLQTLLRLAEDPDVTDAGRTLAAGAILHWLSGSNTIPGVRGGALSYVDDVLLMRLACERIGKLVPEVLERHQPESPQMLATLEDDMALVREQLGDGFQLIERALDRIAKIKHRGRTATQCAADDESLNLLYEDVQSALVDVEVEPEEVARSLKDLDALVDSLNKPSGP